MTLGRALEISGIRQDELGRISTTALDDIIKRTKNDNVFDPYGHKKRLAEAYETIKKEIIKKEV